jgi:tetratricopeptide (TPR) repeat protein
MAEERIINAMKVCNASFAEVSESILKGAFARDPSGPHRTIIGVRKFGMKVVVRAALLVACCWMMAGSRLHAQGQAQPKQTQPKQPAATQQPADSNPFPGDETTVPVLSPNAAPDLPSGSGGDTGRAALPAGDTDPVSSPDAGGASDAGQPASGFSSSSSGIGGLLPGPGADTQGGSGGQILTEHHETAKEDESVGKYYMDNKDWRASLSRYQSAMVLDPQNPDVYWGLAESARHLGQYAEARGYYLKVMEYDPDSRRSKDAAKALKEPEIANAKVTSAH